MAKLDKLATDEEIKAFLMYHIDSADDRLSKINPILTKKQVWDINMAPILRGSATRIRRIITRNIIREFGSYYED